MAGRAAVLSTLSERYTNAQAWITDYISDADKFLQQPISCIRRISGESLTSTLWKGGYPGLINIDETLHQDALNSYLHTYIERDVRLLSEVNDLQQFSSFVQLTANLTAQEIHVTQFGREVGISPQTAQRWLNLLKNTYQWIEIPAYFGNTIKRISSKQKGFFIDSGMACHLMHISYAKSFSCDVSAVKHSSRTRDLCGRTDSAIGENSFAIPYDIHLFNI